MDLKISINITTMTTINDSQYYIITKSLNLGLKNILKVCHENNIPLHFTEVVIPGSHIVRRTLMEIALMYNCAKLFKFAVRKNLPGIKNISWYSIGMLFVMNSNLLSPQTRDISNNTIENYLLTTRSYLYEQKLIHKYLKRWHNKECKEAPLICLL